MGPSESADALLFVVGEPVIARHPGVVLVGLAVAVLPLMELARAELQPAEQPFGPQLAALGPVFDVIDDFVANVVGNPNSF